MIIRIRVVQLLASLVVATLAVDVVIGIFRPDIGAIETLALSAGLTTGFGLLTVAVSATVRGRRRKRLP